MRFMNTWEIDEARGRYADHAVLGPATRTLANLRDAADRNSDGWAYWPKPANAAAKLMELIERDGTAVYRFDDERADATEAEYRKALAPVKAFRTRSGIEFSIEEVGQGPDNASSIEAERQEARQRLLTARALLVGDQEHDERNGEAIEALDRAIATLR